MTRSNALAAGQLEALRAPFARHHGDVAPRLECGVHVVENVRLVVDHQHAKPLGWSTGAGRPAVGAGGRVASGSCTVKVEPRPSSVESMMRPPCSRTMPWLIESPSPVPSPSGLVVKKGSNTWAASASDIPGPSSTTSMATPSSQRRARTTHACRAVRWTRSPGRRC